MAQLPYNALSRFITRPRSLLIGFHHQLAGGISNRDGDRFLVHIHTDILRGIHIKGEICPNHVPFPPPELPVSSVQRASPPSHTARPVSRELPVDPYCDHRWDFPCCAWSPLLACRQYPGRSDGRNLFARTVPPTSVFPETGAGRLLH
jgi:hypothetical protein